MQSHFEFHEWEQAFAEFYRRKAEDPTLCFVVAPDGYGSGYWIEPCSGGVDVGNSEPYNLVEDVNLRSMSRERSPREGRMSWSTNPTKEHREQAREIVRVEQRTQRDCLRCCLAMVTTVDYDDVPDFIADHGESWSAACEAWLSELGMGLLMIPTAPVWTPPWLPIIARGPTELSDEHHFVVVTPKQVIDPHPLQRGLKEVVATYAVVNSGSLANEFIGHLAAKYSAVCSELSSRDTEIREVLEGLSWRESETDGKCWCWASSHEPFCLRIRALYAKLRAGEGGE